MKLTRVKKLNKPKTELSCNDLENAGVLGERGVSK